MAKTGKVQVFPAKEEVKKLAESGKYSVIPVYTQLYADMATPVEVVKRLKMVSGHVFLLESAEDNKRWGRYTFIGYDIFPMISSNTASLPWIWMPEIPSSSRMST